MVPATDTSLPHIFASDIELFGLISGLRPVAKKEGPDAEIIMRRADELRADGWHVERNERTGCVYVSRDAARARRLMELENQEFDGGNPDLRRQTIHEIGLALGYPDCCVRAFAALPVQDDAHVMAAMIRRDGGVLDLPWQLNFLVPMTGPVFYYPCRFDCAASLDLADRYLAAMEGTSPGTTDRLRQQLARPMLVAGRWDFLVLKGGVSADGRLIFSKFRTAGDFHPVPPPTAAFQAFVSLLPPSGTIVVRDGIATAHADGSNAIAAQFRSTSGIAILNYK